MKPSHFVGLAATAGVAFLAAAAVHGISDRWAPGTAAGERLIKSLEADVNNVAVVAVRRGEQTLTLERKDGKWSIRERDGYPAKVEKVRALILQLAGAELAERKTANPERYAALEVEEAGAKDAKSHQVRLSDDKGRLLADVIIGKKRWEAFGSGKSGTYVRRPGDKHAWLAVAELEAPLTVSSWVDAAFFETDRAKIARITIEEPGEEPLRLVKEAGGYKLADMPVDKKLKSGAALSSAADGLARLDLEDVRKSAAPAAGENISAATLEADGGLKVTFRLRRDKDDRWLSLTATGEGDAKAAADAINTRASGWEFKVSPSKDDQIFKRRADLFESS